MNEPKEIRLTEEELLYLIMGWDALRKHNDETYRKHASTATMVRLKLENALDDPCRKSSIG